MEVTRLLVECYFDIVRANLQVPQLPLTCLCLQQYQRHLPLLFSATKRCADIKSWAMAACVHYCKDSAVIGNWTE